MDGHKNVIQPQERRRRSRSGILILAAVVVYVLASGPAQWIQFENSGVPETEWQDPPPSLWRWDDNLDRVFYPLAWLDAQTPIDSLLTPYWDFCDRVGSQLLGIERPYRTHGGVI